MQAPGDELDARLDAALRGYSDPAEAPTPARMVAHVLAASEEKQARDWRWTHWGLAGAAACVLTILILWVPHLRLAAPGSGMRRPGTLPSSHDPLASVAVRGHAPHEAPAQMALAPASPSRLARASVRKPPKLEQFPQPRPLSEQEKLMLAFVSAASPAEQRTVAKAAEPPEFVRVAEMQLPVTQPSTLDTETLGAPHEEHR
jgi:hypothetical protein